MLCIIYSMISWLKRYMIPHGGNNHRPQLLHRESARTTIVMVILFEVFVFLLPTLSFQQHAEKNLAAVLPTVLATLTNEERVHEKLPELNVNPALTRAAELKAQDMATKGYFAHTSPEGKTPWHWLKTAGYEYQYAGENLAINFSDSKDVTAAWMKSPGHRANIVKGMYTEVGTGVATGMYEGRETVFVAQVYASPLSAHFGNGPRPLAKKDTPQTTEVSNMVATVSEPEQTVLGAEAPLAVSATDQEISPVTEATIVQQAQASPAHTTNTVLVVIAGIVFVVVLLTVVIKVNTQHPDLITNGLAVVAVIGGIMVGNTFLSSNNLQTSQTEYSFVPDVIEIFKWE